MKFSAACIVYRANLVGGDNNNEKIRLSTIIVCQPCNMIATILSILIVM